jgi:hypothetical protein
MSNNIVADNIIAFRCPPRPHCWSQAELWDMTALCAPNARHSRAMSWSTGKTEKGDPQFYLLGDDEDCLLCLTRIDHMYVLEDGLGGVVVESTDLKAVIEQGRRTVAHPQRVSAFVMRLLFVVCTCRAILDQKIELMMAETGEQVARYAPQLAAFV